MKLLGLSMMAAVTVAQYCPDNPDLPSPGPHSAQDSNLGPVSMGDIYNTNDCPGQVGVQDFSNMSTSLHAGDSYTLNYHVTSCGGVYNRASAAWIDFNRNGVWEDTEMLGGTAVLSTTQDNLVAQNFTVPADAVDGPTMMRVVVQERHDLKFSPCEAFAYGGVKDFTILLNLKPPMPVSKHTLMLYTDADCQANPMKLLGSNATFGEDVRPWAFDDLTFRAPFMTAFVGLQDMSSVFISDDMSTLKIGVARKKNVYFWQLTAEDLTPLECATWHADFDIATVNGTAFKSYILLRSQD